MGRKRRHIWPRLREDGIHPLVHVVKQENSSAGIKPSVVELRHYRGTIPIANRTRKTEFTAGSELRRKQMKNTDTLQTLENLAPSNLMAGRTANPALAHLLIRQRSLPVARTNLALGETSWVSSHDSSEAAAAAAAAATAAAVAAVSAASWREMSRGASSGRPHVASRGGEKFYRRSFWLRIVGGSDGDGLEERCLRDAIAWW